MNILVISQFYYPEHFSITPLCEGLVQLGHQVTVVTSQPQYGFVAPKEVKRPSVEVLNGVTIHRLNVSIRKQGVLSLLSNYYSYYALSKQFIKRLPKGFDIVLSMSFSPLMSVSAGIDYAKKHRIKHLLYAVDLWPEAAIISGHLQRDSWIGKFVQWWSKKIYQSMDFILIGSPGHADYFSSTHQINRSKLALIIQPSLHEISHLSETQVSDNLWVYAGNLGKLQPLKGLLDNLNQPAYASIKLNILGQGSEKNRLEHHVNRLGLNNRVQFFGSLSAEASAIHLEQASMFIIALHAEGYLGATIPSKAVHYLSYSKPIIGLLGKAGKTWLDSIQGQGFIVEQEHGWSQALDHALAMTQAKYVETQKRIKKYYDAHLSLSSAVKQLEHYLIKLIN